MSMENKSASNSGGLLLDTHVLLWLSVGSSSLNQANMDYISRAAQRREVRLSVISLWEIGYLVGKKKIDLSTDIPTYWQKALEKLRAKELEISSTDIFRYHSLPEGFHGDPGDRFLVSQAMNRQLRLLTADSKLTLFASKLSPAIIVPVGSL